MKKFMVVLAMVMAVMGVMVMGPEEAYARMDDAPTKAERNAQIESKLEDLYGQYFETEEFGHPVLDYDVTVYDDTVVFMVVYRDILNDYAVTVETDTCSVDEVDTIIGVMKAYVVSARLTDWM